ncbi:MAG: DNA repair protein RecO [Elusimicrobia bacterium]|nr:DNA repair protein RecO [Elusimicrobiota bacterium]MDE2425493.1 DNA repair protein RecO [Elusimicrobiota bacterium]
MIVNAWGVVLSRRDHGEADRLCTIYTENLGKLLVRFSGVNKPGRKLKALSEPLSWGEYRLYLGWKSDIGKAIGGQLIGSFPSIRADLERTVAALGCLELLQSLTADRDPNPQKYSLLCETLLALEGGGGQGTVLAYGLRLLDLAGLGLPENGSQEDLALRRRLRLLPLGGLSELPLERLAAWRLGEALHQHAEAQAGRALKCRLFSESLRASVEGLAR